MVGGLRHTGFMIELDIGREVYLANLHIATGFLTGDGNGAGRGKGDTVDTPTIQRQFPGLTELHGDRLERRFGMAETNGLPEANKFLVTIATNVITSTISGKVNPLSSLDFI